MADTYIQGSFAFRCTGTEAALIEEAVLVAGDLSAHFDPDPPSAAFCAAFPPTKPDDPWSGLCDTFPDPDFPEIGADFAREDHPDAPGVNIVSFASMIDFQPEAIAALIRRCCPATLDHAPIGFEWAVSCSKPRLGEFGGGWCVIHRDRIEIETTGERLVQAFGTSR